MPLVFQFGSNVSLGRLNSTRRLNGAAKLIGLCHTVLPFELVFDVWSTTNHCAAASLSPGSRLIYRALYQVPVENIFAEFGNQNTMDRIEGRKYKRDVIHVIDCCSSIKSAITYTTKNPESGLKTDPQYSQHILEGLRELAAPATYISYVEERIEKYL